MRPTCPQQGASPRANRLAAAAAAENHSVWVQGLRARQGPPLVSGDVVATLCYHKARSERNGIWMRGGVTPYWRWIVPLDHAVGSCRWVMPLGAAVGCRVFRWRFLDDEGSC